MSKKIVIGLLIFILQSLFNLSASNMETNGFQQFKLNDWNAVVISDGFFTLSPIQPVIAPKVSKEEFSIFMKENNKNAESSNLAMNILVLRKGDRVVLFDTGVGNGMGESGGKLIKNLALIGIAPEDVTDILITHNHRDHIGGLLNDSGASIFYNATIYIGRVERDFWNDKQPDFSKMIIQNPEMLAMMVKMPQQMMAALEKQIRYIEDGDLLFDGIWAKLTPGHTAGHISYIIKGGVQNFVVLGDVVDDVSIILPHPEWGIGFDYDFDLGVSTRLKVLQHLHNDQSHIFGYHFPYPGIGKLKQIAIDSYKWVPMSFATPQLND